MSIIIDIPNTRCKAGTTIAGTVLLRGGEDVDVQSITISLVGRCKTKVVKSNGNNSTSTYRGRAPLLLSRKVLFNGPHTLHPGHSWDFAFTFPMQCVGRYQDPFKRTGAFNLDAEQSLPPSFSDQNHGFGWHAKCFVNYELEAQLTSSRVKLLSPGNMEAARTLDFFVTRDVESPDPQLATQYRKFDCRSLALHPGHEDVPLSFKEKMKSLRSSKLPSALFKLHMLLPNVGVLGQVLPCFLRLEHDIEGSTSKSPPLVLLRKCLVELHSHTFVQCIRNELFREGDEHRDWKNGHLISSIDFTQHMEKAPPVSEQMDLRDIMKLTIPRYHRPTFSTFNIRRSYKLKICVTVDCAQKSFKAEFNTYDFKLLAADFNPSPVGTSGTVPGYSTGSDDFIDDVAPVYEPGGGPPPPAYQDAKGS